MRNLRDAGPDLARAAGEDGSVQANDDGVDRAPPDAARDARSGEAGTAACGTIYGCADGTWNCLPTGTACADDGAVCPREGEPACNGSSQPSASCGCRDGRWSGASVCPPGCPSSPLMTHRKPPPGETCTLDPTLQCVYYDGSSSTSRVKCVCQQGRFACSPAL